MALALPTRFTSGVASVLGSARSTRPNRRTNASCQAMRALAVRQRGQLFCSDRMHEWIGMAVR